MSTIGGPGGIGGPKGPGDVSAADAPGEAAEVTSGDKVETATTAGAAEIDAMAAEIAAGRLTPREAVERLVDEIAGNDELGATERTELRELLADLVANDPYLAGLAGRVG